MTLLCCVCVCVKDLGTKELTGEIWLVFHIIRVGMVLIVCC